MAGRLYYAVVVLCLYIAVINWLVGWLAGWLHRDGWCPIRTPLVLEVMYRVICTEGKEGREGRRKEGHHDETRRNRDQYYIIITSNFLLPYFANQIPLLVRHPPQFRRGYGEGCNSYGQI
ncbi:hypothetical protein HOY82DRAFT_318246 [Tuber indicum]|nr:hypothetical protein HOY82DRAFT_318246 [Tuber indicum]